MLRCLYIYIAIAVALVTGSTPAAASARNRALLLDRIAVALTGQPATPAQKNAFVSGQRELNDIIDDFKGDARFEANLAQYWLEVLKVDQPFDFDALRNLNNKTMVSRITPTYPQGVLIAISNSDASCVNKQTGIFRLKEKSNVNLRSTLDDSITIDGVTYIDALYDCGCKPYQVTVKDADGNDQTVYQADGVVGGVCTRCDNIIDVNPHWAPETTVKACRLVAHENYCGADLSKCWLDDTLYSTHSTAKMFENLNYGFTMQPGMLIAKIVSHDLSWDNVVAGTKTAVNDTLAWFLNSKFSDPFVNEYAPRMGANVSYPQRKTNPVFTGAVAGNYDKFSLVEAGEKNAGVLSTPAFHRVTNGLRAKANRAYESFLCYQFTPPEGDIPESDEQDLTKRPYCSACHVTLEPMSNFFKHYPLTGNNFVYNPAPAGGAYGQFNGHGGNDVTALGDIMAQMRAYNECAVKRAFDFAMGRPMTASEASKILTPLTDQFEAGGKKLWPILKSIVTSPIFVGGAG